MTENQFSGLIERAQGGDALAIEQLLVVFENDLRTMVRVHLPRALRNQYDSMDFVQAVWTSLFTGEADTLVNFENERHFRGYLAAMARNKVLAEFRRRTKTSKYDLRREEPLYVKKGDREQPRSLVAHDPSPSQQVQADDRLHQMVSGQSPIESKVVGLRHEGLTHQQIADRLGIHERTVRRVLEIVRARIESEPGA